MITRVEAEDLMRLHDAAVETQLDLRKAFEISRLTQAERDAYRAAEKAFEKRLASLTEGK